MNPQGLLLIYDFTEGILMQVRSWLLKKMVSLFEPLGPFFPCCAALEKDSVYGDVPLNLDHRSSVQM